jgi:hypothetical protein
MSQPEIPVPGFCFANFRASAISASTSIVQHGAIIFASVINVGGRVSAPHEGRGIDGAFQPLSTTIVQIIAEFADAYRVRV